VCFPDPLIDRSISKAPIPLQPTATIWDQGAIPPGKVHIRFLGSLPLRPAFKEILSDPPGTGARQWNPPQAFWPESNLVRPAYQEYPAEPTASFTAIWIHRPRIRTCLCSRYRLLWDARRSQSSVALVHAHRTSMPGPRQKQDRRAPPLSRQSKNRVR